MTEDEKKQLESLHCFSFDVVKLNNTNVSTIEVLKIGKILDRNLTITSEMLDQYVSNFHAGIYGSDLQVNLGHNREGEAAGWIKDLYVDADVLMAKVEWTPLGIEKIQSKQFRFTSSELAPTWPDSKTGKKIKNVFIGVALTNVPAVKGMAPVTLSESAEKLFHNLNNMFKPADAHKKLMAQKTVSKEDAKDFAEKVKAHMADQEDMSEEDKKDLADKVKAVKGKAADDNEPDGDEASEKGDKEEAKEEPKKKLAEKVEHVSLAEFNAEKAKRIVLEEKIARQELSEEVKENLLLSEDNKIGFIDDADTTKEVTDFLMGLDNDQRTQFFELMQKVRSVDLSEIGGMGVKVEKVNLSEESVVSLAEALMAADKTLGVAAAQKLAMKQIKEGTQKK